MLLRVSKAAHIFTHNRKLMAYTDYNSTLFIINAIP